MARSIFGLVTIPVALFSATGKGRSKMNRDELASAVMRAKAS